jgi:aminopeptidase N
MVVMLRLVVSAALVAAWAAPIHADTYPRQPGIDAVHYVFRLRLPDFGVKPGSDRGQTPPDRGPDSGVRPGSDPVLTPPDVIAGETTVTLRVTAAGLKEVYLDLASVSAGKGMTVSAVTVGGRPVQHSHQASRLRIPLAPLPAGSEVAAVITYSGTPAGGLRFAENIHGERTAFSENWPNKARQWLPMIDHPYDKATGEFIVTAPSSYQVVANGVLVEEMDLPGNERRTHWRQSVPIASWLYALGVARFAAVHYDVVRGIPQQVWAFPQDRDKASELFELTGRRAFEFFSDWIGPYAYEKLGHVEAAGVTGGMEHATAIFYGEKGVASGRGPVVHEVAHQWWGNAVTENDWDDVWLSEGFATYFTHLYAEQFSGRDAFVRGLKNDIPTIVQAQVKAPDQPVIHRNLNATGDMSDVLNRLVYQKGGWILHMLRGIVGTDKFRAGLREYYRRYRNANASTDDLRQVIEQTSGLELRWFFDQWLKRPGMPKLTGTWRYDASAKQVDLDLRQTQTGTPYRLPMDVGISASDGQQRLHRIELTAAEGRFTIPADVEPANVLLDPNTWVLTESATVTRAGSR